MIYTIIAEVLENLFIGVHQYQLLLFIKELSVFCTTIIIRM